MALCIREATAHDIAAMQAIRVAVGGNRLSDPAWLTPAIWRECLVDGGNANTWVCEAAGAIAGFATGRLEQRDIWELFVEPAHEGLGIGRSLLDVATRWMFDHGLAEIHLGTTPDTRADGFYRRMGWQRGERTAKNEIMYRLPGPFAGAQANQETTTC